MNRKRTRDYSSAAKPESPKNTSESPAVRTASVQMGDEMKLPADYASLLPCERREVREEYIRLQGGKCQHCGEPLNKPAAEKIMKKRINTDLFPKNFFKWPVHLHHNRSTGMTIGAIHCHCNAVLWQYHNE